MARGQIGQFEISTYSIKVKLDILGGSADRDGSIVLNVVLDIDQGDGSVSGSADVSVAGVHLVDLGLGVVLVVGVAGQGDGVAVLGRELEGRGISDDQDRGGQGDKGGDSHYEIFFLVVWSWWWWLEEEGRGEENGELGWRTRKKE